LKYKNKLYIIYDENFNQRMDNKTYYLSYETKVIDLPYDTNNIIDLANDTTNNIIDLSNDTTNNIIDLSYDTTTTNTIIDLSYDTTTTNTIIYLP